ncbi:MAG: hypothetical protein KF782_22310 [Labilithrix sp.]|nr:hypothetical protein [Labilithrix sp.]
MPETTAPIDWLRSAGAQGDVIDGLARLTTWRAVYDECPRGDWLLAIAERLGVEHVALVRAAIACARVADVDDDAGAVLDAAARWADGHGGAGDVAAATRALEQAASRAVDPAREAAGRAALAVGLGVEDRGVLPAAPAAAAESVMVASIDCGLELAMRWAHDRCAAAVRSAVPWSVFAGCVERAGGQA